MAEVLVGSERRVLISGYGLPTPPPPPPDSLLGRLDQIDLRLRQLEEQRRSSVQADDGSFVADAVRRAPAQHHHTKSLPSALQHVHLKGTLMDRLNLLESRIRQLSCELDSGKAVASSTVAPPRPAEDSAWSEPALLEPCKDLADKPEATAGSWSAVQILQRGARELHRSKPNQSKVKNLKEAKCACQNEKRKAERNRAGRRWFTVGC